MPLIFLFSFNSSWVFVLILFNACLVLVMPVSFPLFFKNFLSVRFLISFSSYVSLHLINLLNFQHRPLTFGWQIRFYINTGKAKPPGFAAQFSSLEKEGFVIEVLKKKQLAQN
jgi:hypothetical protein